MKLVHFQSLELLSRMCKVIENISDPKLITDAGIYKAMTLAVHNGNVEFIKSMAKANPELVWTPFTARNIFSLAIKLRQPEIFSLIYGFPHKEALLANYAHRPLPPPQRIPKLPPQQMQQTQMQQMQMQMLYNPPAGSLSSSRQADLIPGPALLLQRNLQWDKVIYIYISHLTLIISNKMAN